VTQLTPSFRLFRAELNGSSKGVRAIIYVRVKSENIVHGQSNTPTSRETRHKKISWLSSRSRLDPRHHDHDQTLEEEHTSIAILITLEEGRNLLHTLPSQYLYKYSLVLTMPSYSQAFLVVASAILVTFQGCNSEMLNELETMPGHTVENDYTSPLPRSYIDPEDLPDSFSWSDIDGVSYLTHRYVR
jgi:hypothetical protein